MKPGTKVQLGSRLEPGTKLLNKPGTKVQQWGSRLARPGTNT